MARRLVQQGVEQRRLAKARDAGDPADVLPTGTPAGATESGHRAISASKPASGGASGTASRAASRTDRPAASRPATGHADAGQPARRRGRPRGPDRVALNVRIRRELDDRLTAAVDQTGQGPQDLVERALERELDRLARAQRRGQPESH